MPQFLYKLKPVRPEMLTNGPTEFEINTVSEHFNYLKSLLARGVLIIAGRTQNEDQSSFGLVVFIAKTETDAKNIMQNDPSVKNKIMSAALFPYKVALFNTEFKDI